MGLRLEIADVLARLPVRCDDDPELDKLRRIEAATAILAIPAIAEALEARAALVSADLVVHNGEVHHLIRGDPNV